MKKTTRMHAVIKVNRTLMVCLFYLFFILLSEPQAQAQTQIPFSSLGYAYEKTITIDHNNVSGGNDLADFPLLVSLVDADIATISNGGHVYSTDGLDIVFTDTAGYILDYEIERYSQTNGTLIAWIRLPVLHWDEDAKIKMLYGNPQFSDNSGSEDVWNSNYKGVWHLHNDLLDATITNNDGKSGNTVPVNGKIADGYEFDDINDTITIGTNGLLTTSGTISLWANTNAISAGPKYIFGHTLQSGWSSRLQLYVESNRGLYLGMGGNHSLASNI
ncbi:MAG: DUF2341 domain-containing protein, partial [Bacteroidales bacterium]|nr:DUF2341 domain-containing protein [Bacteroidales bacterium]